MKRKLIAIALLLPVKTFAQTDLERVIKAGELLLSGISVMKVAKSAAKSECKTGEGVCVKS